MYTVNVKQSTGYHPHMQRGIRKGLTPARILDEAFAMVDSGGPPALTMRALAARLDVAAMAIYNHYRDRDAILDAIADKVFAELPGGTERKPVKSRGGHRWKSHLRNILLNAQQLASRHPNIYLLAMSRPNKPASAFQLTGETLSELRSAGLTNKQALTVYQTFVMLLHGFPFWREGYDRHSPYCAPLQEAIPVVMTVDQQFIASVEWLLNAVEQLAEEAK